jgi:hypothetical protein
MNTNTDNGSLPQMEKLALDCRKHFINEDAVTAKNM